MKDSVPSEMTRKAFKIKLARLSSTCATKVPTVCSKTCILLVRSHKNLVKIIKRKDKSPSKISITKLSQITKTNDGERRLILPRHAFQPSNCRAKEAKLSKASLFSVIGIHGTDMQNTSYGII